MHRITIAYTTPADPESFERRYAEDHVPMVHGLPGLRRFTTSRPRPLAGEAPYLVAELWFDSAEDLKAVLTSPEMGETAAHAQTLGAAMTTYTAEVVDAG